MHDSFTPLGGLGAHVADAARRGDLRRRRLRTVRHDRVCAGRRLRRRLDDRPHAGVPRQEGRGVRGEDGRGGDPDSAAGGAGRHRDRRAPRCRPARALSIQVPTASRRSSTPSPPPATTTAARSPVCPPTRPSTTPRSGSRCSLRATGCSCRYSPSRDRVAAKKTVPGGPGHPSHAHDRCSSCCSIGIVLIVGALTFVPALALRPIVEHFQMMNAKVRSNHEQPEPPPLGGTRRARTYRAVFEPAFVKPALSEAIEAARPARRSGRTR